MKKKILLTIITLNVLIAAIATHLGIKNSNNTNKEVDTPKNDIIYEVPEGPSREIIIDSNDEEKEIVIDEEVSNYENVTLSDYDQEVLSQSITANFSGFLDEVTNINVEYLYSELYSGEHNLEVASVNVIDTDIIQNNQVNYEALYNKVLENNATYMAEHNINNYKNTTDSLVSKVCKLISAEINDLLDGNQTIDRISLNHKLNDLKIFSYVSYSYGFYNQQNGVLAINEETLNAYDTTIINDVIGHEIVHLVQSASREELENANYLERLGYCYKTSDETFNPYNWSWFVEAAAEDYSYKFNGLDEPFVYPAEIKTIETMKLATFNVGSEFSDSLFSSDINTLYRLFGCVTEDDKKEIQKMFYAFTINYDDGPGLEGDNFFQAVYPELGDKEYSRTQTEIKGSACLSLSKIFYRDLANKISGQNVRVEDIFKVISIYELEISRQLWYQSKYPDLEIFLTGYVEIQEAFFNDLASSLAVSLDYVKELYYAYNNEVNITDVNISWLTSAENEYLEYINESRVGNKKEAIFKVYEDNYEKGVNR